MRQRAWLAAASAALVLFGSACGGSSEATPSPSDDAGITTTLADFSIKPAEKEATAGSVTFDLENDGPSDPHLLRGAHRPRRRCPSGEGPPRATGGPRRVGELDNVPFDAAPSITV